MPSSSPRIDFGLLAGVAVVLLVFAAAALLVASGAIHAEEDAAILFSYAVNFGDTGVISFYSGGPRTEGATDFLYMAALAGLYRLGLSPAMGAALLSTAGAVVAFVAIHGIGQGRLVVERPL